MRHSLHFVSLGRQAGAGLDLLPCGCDPEPGGMVCSDAAPFLRMAEAFPWPWTKRDRALASAALAEHLRRNQQRTPERAYFLNLAEVAGVALWYNARRQLHGEDPLPVGAHAVRIERHAAGINVVFRLPDTIEP